MNGCVNQINKFQSPWCYCKQKYQTVAHILLSDIGFKYLGELPEPQPSSVSTGQNLELQMAETFPPSYHEIVAIVAVVASLGSVKPQCLSPIKWDDLTWKSHDLELLRDDKDQLGLVSSILSAQQLPLPLPSSSPIMTSQPPHTNLKQAPPSHAPPTSSRSQHPPGPIQQQYQFSLSRPESNVPLERSISPRQLENGQHVQKQKVDVGRSCGCTVM